jgi:hypothetical protein
MHVKNGRPGRSPRAALALLIAPVAALAVACGSAAGGTGGTGGSTGGGASCADRTPAQLLAGAKVVFVGTALPGRTINGSHGLLVTPARMRVIRYLKGSGPAAVTVQTAVSPSGNGIGAEGVMAHPGQRWKVYSSSLHMPYPTSVCDGSHQVGGSAGAH